MCDMLDRDFALFILPSSHIIMSDKLGLNFALFQFFHHKKNNMCDQLGWDFALFQFFHHK